MRVKEVRKEKMFIRVMPYIPCWLLRHDQLELDIAGYSEDVFR